MNPKKPHDDRVAVDARVTISRPSRGDGKESIRIKIYDEGSRLTIFEGDMDPAVFAMALTGLSDQPCTGTASIASYAIGKVRVYEKRDIVLPADLPWNGGSKWIEKNCQEKGWFVDSYLGSQGSTTYNADGTYTAHYWVFKYVDKNAS